MKVEHHAKKSPLHQQHHYQQRQSVQQNVSFHPWVTTTCVVILFAILAAAVFWIKKWRSTSVPRHEYAAVCLETVDPSYVETDELRSYQKYLGDDSRYTITTNLGPLGSRADKSWFLVKDKKLNADRLLTLIQCNQSTTFKPSCRPLLLDLFRSLHHPYVLPILDIEFWDIGLALVSPLNQVGSLKDLIYGSHYNDPYGQKYHCGKGLGLPYKQVQYLGRQILEALLFLRTRNFPKFVHLHSGNVIVQNGVARLTALENALFALTPRHQPPLEDTLAFGYLLYEMTTGGELPGLYHKKTCTIDVEYLKIHDLIEWIFEEEMESRQAPSIEELLRHDAFKGVELRELRRTTGISYSVSEDVNELLDSMSKVTPRQSNGLDLQSDDEDDIEMLDVALRSSSSSVGEDRFARKGNKIKNRCSSR